MTTTRNSGGGPDHPATSGRRHVTLTTEQQLQDLLDQLKDKSLTSDEILAIERKLDILRAQHDE